MLLLLMTTFGVITAQTIMEVDGIPGESNYSFAKGAHTLRSFTFKDAEEWINLALKPPRGYEPIFDAAIEKTLCSASPKFAEALLKGKIFSTLTVKKYERGRISAMVKMEGVTISSYSMDSKNQTESFEINAKKSLV